MIQRRMFPSSSRTDTSASVACPLYHISPRYLINSVIFGKKLLNMKCVCSFSVQLMSETFAILRRIQRDIINVLSFHVKYPLFLSDFNET
jgi:hypothetical protein